ncbi:MAG TPA: carboxypeptidase-like regulatory domain-containing protein, partial [Candidatus Polarisedimenticolia bacterium]|nr:carboxypeptidase-like regulatory domain-containing protein [Candidatus Polarisedimenticolia bacterium]
ENAPSAGPDPPASGSLSGRVTGAAAAEVLLFGPNNILKLHARAPIGADGSYRFPMPPPGAYRLIVAERSGAHLFTRPQLRSVTVTPESRELTGLDFEIRGRL